MAELKYYRLYAGLDEDESEWEDEYENDEDDFE